MVQAEIDTTNIRIGEQFQLKISVAETTNVIIPAMRLKGLEVVDSTRIDTLKNSLVRRYILTGFDSGAFYIPQQQIFVKNKNLKQKYKKQKKQLFPFEMFLNLFFFFVSHSLFFKMLPFEMVFNRPALFSFLL